MKKTLTKAQADMLGVIAERRVQSRSSREGVPFWLVDGKRATGAQTRVIDNLEAAKIVRKRLVPVRIVGLREPKRVWLLLPAEVEQ